MTLSQHSAELYQTIWNAILDNSVPRHYILIRRSIDAVRAAPSGFYERRSPRSKHFPLREDSILSANVYFALRTTLIINEPHGSTAGGSVSALTGEVTSSPNRGNLCKEQVMKVQKISENPVVEPDIEHKTRQCLICRSPFASAWAGERICRGCKSKAAWRSGVLGP